MFSSENSVAFHANLLHARRQLSSNVKPSFLGVVAARKETCTINLSSADFVQSVLKDAEVAHITSV